MRSVAIAHLGDLLGLIVLERPSGDAPFTEEEDRVLVELSPYDLSRGRIVYRYK